jgi:hypothetical protein
MLGHPTKALVEQACEKFLVMGVGLEGSGTVIIRSGSMGAYISNRVRGGRWIPAFWGMEDIHRVIDVTGTQETVEYG